MTTPTAGDGDRPRAKRTSYTGGITDGNLNDPMQLRDFLFGVGTVFQLPEQTSTTKLADAVNAATAAQEPEPEQVVAGRGRRQAFMVAGALIAALGFLAFRLWPRGETRLPAAVLGEWTTDDPRYAGRVLRLADQEVAFVVAGRETAYPLAAVRTRQAGDTAYLTVEYIVAGRNNVWPLAFVPSPSPSLTTVNQPGLVWTRRGHGPHRSPGGRRT